MTFLTSMVKSHNSDKFTCDLIRSFPPVVNASSRMLILGSMPGAESLRRGEYYAHPRNQFWPIMMALFHDGKEATYRQRTNILLWHRIALWDVVHSCRRSGSLDANMSDIEANDLNAFFRRYPSIRDVFCNGQTSMKLFRRHFPDTGCRVHLLPSTSPAYTLSLSQKLARWKRVLIGNGVNFNDEAARVI